MVQHIQKLVKHLWKYPDREKLLLAQLGIKLKKLIIAMNNQLGVHQVGNRQLARLMLTAWFLHYYDRTWFLSRGVSTEMRI